MMRKPKIYSGIYQLPAGRAADTVTEGCLVLEGGAFRGLYTSGVLDALMEAGLNFQTTVGVSAGAMNGMNYVSGQIGRSARINLRYRHDSRYVGLHAVRKNRGLIGFDFVFGHMDEVPEFDMARFSDRRRRFYAVVTNLATGEPEYLEKEFGGSVYEAIRASASMPYVSGAVCIGGHEYLDGGCSVNIPYQWAMEQGFEKIVVVRTREASFRKELTEQHGEYLPEQFYHAYPVFAAKLRDAAARYNAECDRLAELEAEGRIAVIAPSEPVSVGRLEPDMEKLGSLYSMGYQDGQRAVPEIQAYLKGEQQA